MTTVTDHWTWEQLAPKDPPPAPAPKLDPLQRRLSGALDTLAGYGGPDEIAAALQAAHVTGVPGQAGACPVSRYLSARFGGVRARVYLEHAEIALSPAVRASVGLPPDVARFVLRFDGREYPGLIK